MTEKPNAGAAGASVPPLDPLDLEQFRREVRDKLFVVFHGASSRSPLHRNVVRQQCEDFLVELYANGLAAVRAAAVSQSDYRLLLVEVQTLRALVRKYEAERAAVAPPTSPQSEMPGFTAKHYQQLCEVAANNLARAEKAEAELAELRAAPPTWAPDKEPK